MQLTSLSFKLDPCLRDELKIVVTRNRRTLSSVLEELVRGYTRGAFRLTGEVPADQVPREGVEEHLDYKYEIRQAAGKRNLNLVHLINVLRICTDEKGLFWSDRMVADELNRQRIPPPPEEKRAKWSGTMVQRLAGSLEQRDRRMMAQKNVSSNDTKHVIFSRPPIDAMECAARAIELLESIPADDPLRKDAFDRVERWFVEERKKVNQDQELPAEPVAEPKGQ